MKTLCPCCSGELYESCCQPFHQGKLPENALQLMRSRYAAYAVGLPDYIMKTTHSLNSEYSKDQETWSKQILSFCHQTAFVKLEILDFEEQGKSATVTFIARLIQLGKDASFTEKSLFEKKGDIWLYRSGQVETMRNR